MATLLFHRNARPVLVGSYALATEDMMTRQASAFIIAEEGQDGERAQVPARQDRGQEALHVAGTAAIDFAVAHRA